MFNYSSCSKGREREKGKGRDRRIGKGDRRYRDTNQYLKIDDDQMQDKGKGWG